MSKTIEMTFSLTPEQWQDIAGTLNMEVEAEQDNEDMDPERCETLSKFAHQMYLNLFTTLTGQTV